MTVNHGSLVTVVNNEYVPPVGIEALGDVLSEGDVGVSVNGDICVRDKLDGG